MKDISISQIKEAIEEYNTRYNTRFYIGNKYALFPKRGEYGYENEWPGNGHSGVYFVMNENDQLLYVGQSKSLGERLNEHFPSKKENNIDICTFKEKWSELPHYLYVATAPDDAIWERLSFEEFLIQKFNPIDNTMGCSD